MKLAEKFQRPILTFIDTPGAYPGVDAEQRGQAEAIARNLLEMIRLTSADYCGGHWRRRKRGGTGPRRSRRVSHVRAFHLLSDFA